MTTSRIYLIILFHLLFGVVAAGQGVDDKSNWYKEIGRGDDYLSSFDFKRYSKGDIEAAKARYLEIASASSDDDWAGSYRMGTMLGSAEVIWDRRVGFVFHYVYHTLAGIDYGRVVARADSVWFVSEKPGTAKIGLFKDIEHIKVKFGERHLLVPQSRLADFAILAAGLEVPRGRRVKEIEAEQSFFWEKVNDEEKAIADTPTYPEKYSYLVRRPIQMKVVSVSKLTIKRETSKMWGTTSEDHLRSLVLSSGHRRGVKVGMRFWLDDLEEWIEVVSVSPNRSVADLSRQFIEGKEYCAKYYKGDVIEFPCRLPRVGMIARTKTDYF